MSTTTMLDENLIIGTTVNPGAQLATIREQKGYTVEYIAGKLHLRTRIIELIESNDFNALPAPVFVKGYLRAYAKLLDVSPEPYLAVFQSQYETEHKTSTLWQQSKRETHKAEHVIRWFTLLFAIGVVVAVGMWWQKNNDSQQQVFSEKSPISNLSLQQNDNQAEVKLNEISQVQTILNPKPEMSTLENVGG